MRKQPEKEKFSVKKYIFPLFGCQNLGIYTSIPVLKPHSLERATKSHLEKQSHLKSQFPPEMTLLKSQQNFQSHLKFAVHSHLEYMLQKVIKITGVKLTVGRHLLIGIYWYQSTNRRFIHSHLFTIGYYQTRVNTFLEFKELLSNNTKHFSVHLSVLTFSESYWQTILHNFPEFISINTDTSRKFLQIEL